MPVSKPRWRGPAVFGAGRRVPVDREFLAVYRAKLRLNRRPGRLTLAAVRVGEYLVRTVGADGRLDPSNGTIALACGIDRSTAGEARKRLKECGFLQWDRRLRRDAGTGWRAEQTSNAYRLLVPACEADFPRQVNFGFPKKVASRIESPLANAARQLRLLNSPVPIEWGNV